MRTIHPFLRRADTLYHTLFFGDHDSSPPAKGRPHPDNVCLRPVRFIPSCEGQTRQHRKMTTTTMIHPFLQRADTNLLTEYETGADSSLPTKGGRAYLAFSHLLHRFIPSYEGQTVTQIPGIAYLAIHPLIRGADICLAVSDKRLYDSSPPTRGRLCPRARART